MIRNKINKRQSLWFDYKIKKRLVTSFFAGLILIFSSSLTFALELRIGHFAPVGHPITLGTTKAAETIKQLSGGDIILKDGGTEFGRFTQLLGGLTLKSGPSASNAVIIGTDSNPNIILDLMYENPFINAARVSCRYPDIIFLEISERVPFARVNIGPAHMIMLDEYSFVIPNIEEVRNYSVPTLSKFNSEPELYPIGEKALSIKIKDTIRWLRILYKKHPDLYHNISEIFLTNKDEINLVLAENPTIIMLGNKDTQHKLDLLKEFEKTISGKKEITDYAYLDMRYNNQVIVKE